jgi:hypothetical protein
MLEGREHGEAVACRTVNVVEPLSTVRRIVTLTNKTNLAFDFSAAAGSSKGQRCRARLLLGFEDRRMDVALWLQDLPLRRYVLAFRDNEINETVLPSLASLSPALWHRVDRLTPFFPTEGFHAEPTA